MPRRKRKRSPDGDWSWSQSQRELEPSETSRQRLALVYYERLLRHAPFASEVRAVFSCLAEQDDLLGQAWTEPHAEDTGLSRLGAAALLSLANAAKRAVQDASAWNKHVLVFATTTQRLLGEPAARWWLCFGTAQLKQALSPLRERCRALRVAGLQAAAEALQRRWPLPASAAHDIHESYALWQAAGRPDPLVVVPAGLVAAGPGEAVLWLPSVPTVITWRPGSEPVRELRQRIDALLDAFEAAASAQAQAAATQAHALGWRPTPAHELRQEALERRAERLFQRLVRKQTYDDIADAETPQTPESVEAKIIDSAVVRKSVTRDAKLLGIPLPSSLA